MLSRRNFIPAAIGAAAAARLDRWAAIRIGGRGLSGYGMLAQLWVDLGGPAQMGRACLQALPGSERSAPYLARTILKAAASTGSGCLSPRTLRRCIRENSHVDFKSGRIVDVEGWILSLTEARVYALGSLLAENTPPPSPPPLAG